VTLSDGLRVTTFTLVDGVLGPMLKSLAFWPLEGSVGQFPLTWIIAGFCPRTLGRWDKKT
jgi:hypothetical protein